MSGLVERVEQAMCTIAWRMLGSVGMSTSEHAVPRASVDPECCLLLAALGGVRDPRLVDEARDWLVTNQDLIAAPVLKTRLRQLDDDARARWSIFVAPVGRWVRATVPGAAATHDRWEPTRRTALLTFGDEAQWAHLRYRAIFGMQARASIMQLLAAEPADSRGYTAEVLAQSTGFGKSAVRETLDRLARANIVRVDRVGNADWFTVVDARAIVQLAGPAGLRGPQMLHVVHAMWSMHVAARHLAAMGTSAGPVAAHAALGDASRALGSLGLQLPLPHPDPEALGGTISAFIADVAASLEAVEQSGWPRVER